MLGLVKYELGKGKLKLEEMPKPALSEDDVLIKVSYCGICTNDLQIFNNKINYNTPVVLGHEFCGTVVDVGRNVNKSIIGNRVVSEVHTDICGECVFCKSGNYMACTNRHTFGRYKNGAFAEYISVPHQLVHVIPDSISDEEATFIEPAAILVYAMTERMRIDVEDFVVVMGSGRMGLMALQIAKIAGAGKVLVAGRNADAAERFLIAKQLGADYVVNIDKEDLPAILNDLTGGLGADVVVDCTGSESAIALGFDVIKKLGKYCAIGVAGETVIDFGWDQAVFKSCEVYFSYSSKNSSWIKTINLLKTGKLKVKPLITGVYPINEWEEAFSKMLNGSAVKIILKL